MLFDRLSSFPYKLHSPETDQLKENPNFQLFPAHDFRKEDRNIQKIKTSSLSHKQNRSEALAKNKSFD